MLQKITAAGSQPQQLDDCGAATTRLSEGLIVDVAETPIAWREEWFGDRPFIMGVAKIPPYDGKCGQWMVVRDTDHETMLWRRVRIAGDKRRLPRSRHKGECGIYPPDVGRALKQAIKKAEMLKRATR